MFNDELDSILTALKSDLENGLVDDEIFILVFKSSKPINFDQLMNKLIENGYVSLAKKAYKHYYGKSFRLTLEGIKFIELGGYKSLDSINKQFAQTQAEKESLELQQLRSNVEILTNQHFDYLKDRKRFVRNEWAMWIGILLSIIALLITIISKK